MSKYRLSSTQIILSTVFILVILLAGGLSFLTAYLQQNNTPRPQNVSKASNFSLQYTNNSYSPVIDSSRCALSSQDDTELLTKDEFFAYLLLTPKSASLDPESPKGADETPASPTLTTDKPLIAIVIDDVGINKRLAEYAMLLPKPVTISLLPYGIYSRNLAREMVSKGHDILVHIPMEPLDSTRDPGDMALYTYQSSQEIETLTRKNIEIVEHAVGVNNHMGSKFTADTRSLHHFFATLRQFHNFLFLDSLTTNLSKASLVAEQYEIQVLRRDIFIDNLQESSYIELSLRKLEVVARRQGYAIAIAHPYQVTLDSLRKWMGSVEGRGFELVTISNLARRMTNSNNK